MARSASDQLACGTGTALKTPVRIGGRLTNGSGALRLDCCDSNVESDAEVVRDCEPHAAIPPIVIRGMIMSLTKAKLTSNMFAIESASAQADVHALEYFSCWGKH